MNVIVLGGGYGTRLARDIHNDSTKKFQHLLKLPKALLPIGGIPLLTRWVQIFRKDASIDHVYIEARFFLSVL